MRKISPYIVSPLFPNLATLNPSINDVMLTEDELFYMVEEDNENNYLQLQTI